MTTRTQHQIAIATKIFVAILITVPFVASASWWNPTSWFGGWFGLFGQNQNTVQEVSIEDATSTEDTGGSGFFTRAKPKTPPPAPPQKNSESAPSIPPASPPPSYALPFRYTPAPQPSYALPINPSAPQGQAPSGNISFSSDISVHRYTSGSATSSNTIRIWLPSTSTSIQINNQSKSGIYFQSEQCRGVPCTITNVAFVSSSIPEGTYPVTMTVTSGTSTAIGTFSVIVLPPEPLEIHMSVSGPITVKKSVGGSASGGNTISISALRGTPQTLTLTNGKFPDGITGNTTLGTCNLPCTIQNWVSISSSAETGRHPMVVRATGGGSERSVSYDINVGYSDVFGMSFKGEDRTFIQNENPTAKIVMDYPFDLLLDGGSPETATLSTYYPHASTSVQFSQTTCRLPCKNLNAHIEILPGMKAGYYNITLNATVDRQEDNGSGGTRTVKYTKTKYIPIQITPISLPY